MAPDPAQSPDSPKGRRDRGHHPGGPDHPSRPRHPGGSAADYALEDSLGYLVNETSRSIRRRFNQELTARDLKITGEQFAVLVHLWHRGGQYSKDLAAMLAKDKTTIARLVQGLQVRGLVEQVPDPADLRHKRVHLTAVGRAGMRTLFAAANAVLSEATRDVAPNELAICKEVLSRVQQSLSDQHEGGRQ